MMLSTQAARMGSVHTTLRKIGMKSHPFCSIGAAVSRCHRSAFSLSETSRRQLRAHRGSVIYKSSLASNNENDWENSDDLDLKTKGFKAAVSANSAKANFLANRSHEEAWMINLDRDGDKEWLTGPRTDEWFTGVHPRECPGVDENGMLRSLPLPNLSSVTRTAAKDYFDNSWTLYEILFSGLNGDEGFFRPPVHGLRHPQIFYYGHTACLYVNKLRVSGVLQKPVNAYFESIFEVGVDEMVWDDMQKCDMLWPTVSEVHEYKKQVYQTVVDAIMNHPSLDDRNGGVKVDQSHPMWALFMGFEHERIHLETSSVLFREMPYHLVQTPKHWPNLHPSAFNKHSPTSNPIEGSDYPRNRLLMVEGETVDIGKPADFPSFGWDNEYGERKLNVPGFYASEHMVTNGEFWQFVSDGGYRNRQYWCDDGWSWRTHRNMKWPFFWEPAGPAGSNEFNLRTIFKIVNMPWSWPVDVNYYEAKAYCRWKSEKDGSPTDNPFRILTEAEHHVIRERSHNLTAARNDAANDKVMVTSGLDFAKGRTGANLNLAFSSQSPVDYFPSSHTGHHDTTGSAWEWTEDHFNPLDGFEVHHVYDDFSTPCFDGKHNIIVGGSFISTGDEASVFARFHFRPHFLQHSGFRLVASDKEAPATHLFADSDTQRSIGTSSRPQDHKVGSSGNGSGNIYETDGSLHMYLGLHYPSSGEKENVPSILPHKNAPNHGIRFPQRVVKLLESLDPKRTNNQAIDIGCAVGGASFELAKTYDHVDAFDFSHSFVQAAERMQREEETKFRIPIEADLYEEVTAVHEDLVSREVRNRVKFFTGDACKLPEMVDDGKISSYDGAIMSNLLCRLPDPIACLDGLPGIINKGGVIVMVTPFSWLEEFTPRGKWLGGFYDPVSKEPIRSKDVLQELMQARGFEKIHEEEIPLVIREHQRKYQYIISEATGWRKIE